MDFTTTIQEIEDARSEFHYLRARFLRHRGWESCSHPERPGTYWRKNINGQSLAMEPDVALEIEKSAAVQPVTGRRG